MSHYEVLGLQSPSASQKELSHQDLKRAYRQALLRHHPDKARTREEDQSKDSSTTSLSNKAPGSIGSKPSIDQITFAYQTLLDPTARLEYDRTLLLHPRGDDKQPTFHTGLDTVDLDDLDFEEDAQMWHKACRCGQERGYVITENQLEQVADIGEIIIGCRGCSLWLKVLFGVAEGGPT